jgi:hypothetical protein
MNAHRYAGQRGLTGSGKRMLGRDEIAVSGGVVVGLDVYSGGVPEDYVPDIGFVDLRGAHYEPYEVSFAQAPPPDPQGIAGLRPAFDEPDVKYSDCLMTRGLFEHLMELQGADLGRRLDLESMAETKAGAQLAQRGGDLEEIAGSVAPVAEPAPQLAPAQVDYAGVDQQGFVEEQRRILDNRFGPREAVPLDRGTPEELVFHVQEILFDPAEQVVLPPEPQMPETMRPYWGPEPPPGP